MHLDLLGRAHAHLHVVGPAHVVLDVLGEVVAGDGYALVGADAAQRDYGNLGGAAAYVHNHVAFGGKNVDSYTQSGSHRLVYHIDVAAAGVLR